MGPNTLYFNGKKGEWGHRGFPDLGSAHAFSPYLYWRDRIQPVVQQPGDARYNYGSHHKSRPPIRPGYSECLHGYSCFDLHSSRWESQRFLFANGTFQVLTARPGTGLLTEQAAKDEVTRCLAFNIVGFIPAPGVTAPAPTVIGYISSQGNKLQMLTSLRYGPWIWHPTAGRYWHTVTYSDGSTDTEWQPLAG